VTGSQRDQVAAVVVEVEGKLAALRLAIGSKKRTADDVAAWLEEARDGWRRMEALLATLDLTPAPRPTTPLPGYVP
jgi:hypothetical protein